MLASYPGSEPALIARLALCFLFHRAFKLTNEIGYLNAGFSIVRDIISSASPQIIRAVAHVHFSLLLERFSLSFCKEDVVEFLYQLAKLGHIQKVGDIGNVEIYYGCA